ncbi:MAG: alanine--tRNA ligase [Gemmataceae bacterium]
MPSSTEIRQQFIDFFCRKHGHTNVPSSPVVPHDDPTLLFANAGMNQFKPYFLGTEQPKFKRVANSQKCIRAGGKHNDLDDVGKDTYHHTFFEMLGNWSFGDYFKQDAITWAWELLTDVWQLDKSRLHVTVFEGDKENNIPKDDEAAEIWKSVGVLPGHIHLGNKKDNFWEMGETGPCGPCTEIHYDSTPDKSGAKLVNGGSDQCVEIWNNVFIQFNRNPDKSLTPLPAKHVDTGMGFERITKVLQGKSSNYETDVFTPIFAAIQHATKAWEYTGKLEDHKDTAYRVVADHIRTLTFALTDGARIGNEGRDYVLRRVLRRAERYGRQYLGATEPFLHKLVPSLVELMGGAFPELKKNPEKVREQIYEEEVGFLRTLDRGIKLFNQIADKERSNSRTVIQGPDAFKLHDTFGLLIDITQQMASEAGLSVDVAAYEKEMEAAKERARKGGKKFTVTAVKGELPKTDDSLKYAYGLCDAKVLGWVIGSDVIRTGTLQAGETAALILDRTNFYAEQGGQVGDTGTIDNPKTEGLEFQVEDTQRLGETVLHFGTVLGGTITVGDKVRCAQSTLRRIDIMRNHTATHILNLTLRQVLGQHVEQKGSLVDDGKTRFDFAHDKPLSTEEIRDIESRVNRFISRDEPVTAITMPLEEAKKILGVRAVFGEKYPDPVRVVMIGPDSPAKARLEDSVEFCGGNHVPRTGTIGSFKIVGQEPVAKGVRRLTAVTGRVAAETIAAITATVDELTSGFQCQVQELPTRVAALQEELKKLKAQVAKSAAADLAGAVDQLLAQAPVVGGTTIVVGQIPAVPNDAVRSQIDRIRQKVGSSIVVFGSVEEDKVPLVVALSQDLVKKGLKAGDLIKPVAEVVGGKGGGKPDIAQAGGKDAAKLPEALAKAVELARKAVGA